MAMIACEAASAHNIIDRTLVDVGYELFSDIGIYQYNKWMKFWYLRLE